MRRSIIAGTGHDDGLAPLTQGGFPNRATVARFSVRLTRRGWGGFSLGASLRASWAVATMVARSLGARRFLGAVPCGAEFAGEAVSEGTIAGDGENRQKC